MKHSGIFFLTENVFYFWVDTDYFGATKNQKGAPAKTLDKSPFKFDDNITKNCHQMSSNCHGILHFVFLQLPHAISFRFTAYTPSLAAPVRI